MQNPPTAILAAGAGLTEGMLNVVTSWTEKDQRAISLIGYSDHRAFRWWRQSGLTVVDLPIAEIAADLCRRLIQQAQAGPGGDFSPGNYLYDSRLVLRGSVHPFIAA